MLVTFSANIKAADTKRRTITGLVVPFHKPGNTSAGLVEFALGAFGDLDATKVKVLRQHDANAPVGWATSLTVTPGGIIGELRIAETNAGNDILVEAAEGLRDGISVGAFIEDSEQRGDVLVVTAARLVEISLVTEPAFSDARVTEVAASAAEENPETEAPAEAELTTEENPEMEETPTVAVEAAAAAPVQAAAPIHTAPRALPPMTAGEYGKVLLSAARGDIEAQSLVTAANEATTTNNAGVVPVTYSREIIGVIDGSRPFVDSVERRPLPASGMSFKVPRWDTFPSVAETAELGAPSLTQTVIDDLDVSIVKFAGRQKVSIELIERSDPSYLNDLFIAMAAQYAQATDAYAYTEASTGAGASSGTGYVSAIADGIADSYAVMRKVPNKLIASPDVFAGLVGAKDADGRPLFHAVGQTANAGGLMSGITGNVMGLDLVVDANVGSGVLSVYPSASGAFYESGTAQARVTVIDSLTVDVAVYGFVAYANKYPTALRALTVG